MTPPGLTLHGAVTQEVLDSVEDSRLPWALALDNLGHAIEAMTPEERRRLREITVTAVQQPSHG